MGTYNRTAGDKDTIVAYLYGVTATPSTSEAHVWQTGTTKTTLVAATFPGTDDRGKACLVCTVTLGTWLSTMTAAAVWFIEYQVTFPDTSEITWPGEQPDQIIVRAQAV